MPAAKAKKRETMRKPGCLHLNCRRLAAKCAIIVMCCITAAACSTSSTLTPAPTQTLIPFTPTPIPPTATVTPTLSRSSISPVDLAVTRPAVLLELPSESERRVAQAALDDLEVAADALDLIHVESVRWSQEMLDCSETIRVTGGNPGYQVYVVAGDTVYVYHADVQNTVRSCGETDRFSLDADILLKVDPVAAEMAALAQSRLAEQFIVSTSSIQLVDIRALVWDDSSLGCPVRGQAYSPGDVQGYRIVLKLNDTEYIYHTDDRSLIPCAREDEVLSER